tara:strand:+ start:345 stop:698 length:354 start_codon:yes stop_codon:yes gene_type:complete
MAANGYGYGNLPMGLYKLVEYGTQSEGWDIDGDYEDYGVYRIHAYKIITTDRPIVSPAGLAVACGGDKDSWDQWDDYTLHLGCGFWRWVVDGSYLDENWSSMLDEEGLDDDWQVDAC